MNENQHPPLTPPAADGNAVGRLLRISAPHARVPAELIACARAAAAAEWRRTVRWRSRRRILVAGGAVAATVLLTFAWGTRSPWHSPELLPEMPPAQLETVRGGLVCSSTIAYDGHLRPLSIGDEVAAGTLIATDDGARAAFRLADGQSLRLDAATRVQLVSRSVVRLDSGAVYVDSDGAGTSSIEVRTALAVAHDIGTQFEVRLDHRAMRVRVREGMVRIEHAAAAWEVSPGAELTIAAGGLVGRRQVPLYGPAWHWNMEIAPTFELEGSSLAAFLAWVTRENGWELRFTDPTLATYAASVTLHGSLDKLTPDQTPELVLPTCGLVHRVENGVFIAEYPKP
ncbi:MAG: FecR domain-containing protein [bacterium]|nr:FecR domain-containing protein [bacterium]